MAREPSFLFDGAQPNQTYTVIILDLPIVAVSTGSPSVFLTPDMSYLSFVQTSLRPIADSNALSSQREPLVPFGTPRTASTEPHLMVTLLFATPLNSTLPRRLQHQLRETGQCEDSRSKFNYVDFLVEAGLGVPVAANWFSVAWNIEQGNADYVTTVIPTITRTVTTSALTASSTFPASNRTKTAGSNQNPPPTLVLPITGGKTAGVSWNEGMATKGSTSASGSTTLESAGQIMTGTVAQPSLRTNTSSWSSSNDSPVSLGASSLTTVTLNPTAALGGSSDAATGGTGGPAPTSTAGLGVTAGGVRDSEPALVGAVAALMVTAGFYWIFM
ncbi:hypothetical protein BR93DRAFT_147437 [Coniochaeta sp. PMI_546]|nr:hypothetical protein BR93DRAFT_147437 [Coniochaeta sp. PMI_546]